MAWPLAGLQLRVQAEAGGGGAVRGAAGRRGWRLPRDARPLHVAAPQGLWRRRPAGARRSFAPVEAGFRVSG